MPEDFSQTLIQILIRQREQGLTIAAQLEAQNLLLQKELRELKDSLPKE